MEDIAVTTSQKTPAPHRHDILNQTKDTSPSPIRASTLNDPTHVSGKRISYRSASTHTRLAQPAIFQLGDKELKLDVYEDQHGQRYANIQQLRAKTGITFKDEGLMSVAVCSSNISRIDGEKGELYYRGIPIQELIDKSFTDVAHLLAFGCLPNPEMSQTFSAATIQSQFLPNSTIEHFSTWIDKNTPPLMALSAIIGNVGLQFKDINSDRDIPAILGISSVAIAFIIRERCGFTWSPHSTLGSEPSYIAKFLNMLFPEAKAQGKISSEIIKIMEALATVHADHGMNASTFTLRAAASSQNLNPYHLIQTALGSLAGPSHGGANKACLEMLLKIQKDYNSDCSEFLKQVVSKKERLMGFGHRVYKAYDPRAKELKALYHKLLSTLEVPPSPLFKLAQKLETLALNDAYFKERNLFPNLDFYSGLILLLLFEHLLPSVSEDQKNIFVDSLTLFFALGRTAGWLAHWKEIVEEANEGSLKIIRPRMLGKEEELRPGFFFRKPKRSAKL